MNKIASVIVDVPAQNIDREFDYLIPDHLSELVSIGQRVMVPFGPRTITGFITQLKHETAVAKLKPIYEIMDQSPVLTTELMQLADWLADTTLSFKISAYFAMLPNALKAKYEKHFRIISSDVPFSIELAFSNRKTIEWEQAKKEGILIDLLKETKLNTVSLDYVIKEKTNKKYVKYLKRICTLEQLEAYGDQLKNAKKQKQVIQHFLDSKEEVIQWPTLSQQLNVSTATISPFIQKELLQWEEVEVYRDPYEHKKFQKTSKLQLTKEQANCLAPILTAVEEKRSETFLLHGVTGSGKTEVYLQAIERVLEKGKEAICLVPEIALTPMMVSRFKSRFGNLVACLHSGLSNGEKYDEWRKILNKEVKVVVGARSAIFAPFENIGMIIIDEEHETTYKQEDNPKYHARDVAIKRSEYYQCPVILGSATPSLESFARASKGVYHLLSMPSRMNQGSLPKVDIIDMRDQLKMGNRSMFSNELLEKMKDRLAKKEQIVLFLNKRGYSSFVMCRNCGYVVKCPNCDISLTLHKASSSMKCHYCSHEEIIPTTCKECNSEHIRYFGTGTQKVEEELLKVLPEARVIRMDVDTTTKKGSHERLLDLFGQQKADILLGTQMIAKGLDFPNITLVGVLSADTMLNLPDFRASEKTFQLLTQVSGRAGRHHLPGEVIIQTYTPNHYSIALAKEHDYLTFYQEEMNHRRLMKYPPYYYLALVTVSHEDLLKTIQVCDRITKTIANSISLPSICLGPVASPLAKINNRYRYQCLVKYRNEKNLNQVLKQILIEYQGEVQSKSLTISVDINPYIMM